MEKFADESKSVITFIEEHETKVREKNNNEKHDHISISFNNGIALKYNDVRKFGYFFKISNPISLYNFKNLGVEPYFLKTSESYLLKILKKKKK